jgi:hypothetical protein
MKRILSLDGGGVRGIFTLQILARIEALFREERGKPDLVLADVFDMMAGTSTGAIIATFLSWGKTVQEIEDLYLEFAPAMFTREHLYRRTHSKYRPEEIGELFKSHLAEDDSGRVPALLGTSRLRTQLVVVMRNATTGSPWIVTNNPGAMYNDRSRTDCNLDVPLWKLLRASTAAPTFFPPEEIAYGDQKFLFVDGGVTPFNNPTVAAIRAATLAPFGLNWPTGRTNLHIVSVGTIQERSHLPTRAARDINLRDQFHFLPSAVLGAIAVEQDVMCRLLGDCLHGEAIDSELGDLQAPSLLSAAEQKFSYVRYNRTLTTKTPADLGAPTKLDMRLDSIGAMTALREFGRDYAQSTVLVEHLAPRGERDVQAR